MHFLTLKKELENVIDVVIELESANEMGFSSEAEAEAIRQVLEMRRMRAVAFLNVVKIDARAVQLKTSREEELTHNLLSFLDNLNVHVMTFHVRSTARFDTTVFNEYIQLLSELSIREMEEIDAERQSSTCGYRTPISVVEKVLNRMNLGRTPPPPVITHSTFFKTYKAEAMDASDTLIE